MGLSDVGRLPWRQRQRNRVVECIDDGVDLCCQAAAGTADGLILAVFFLGAGAVLMGTDEGRVGHHELVVGIGGQAP